MPERVLNDNDNLESIQVWLRENLDTHNLFTPLEDAVPEVNSRGIYFWYMNTQGYEHLGVTAVAPAMNTTIDNVGYSLVYLGTAGTGRNGNSTIADRLNWHINQLHNNSSVCSGALSTLRAGIGSLLADDLIQVNTCELVNNFLRTHMKVRWLSYDDATAINSDEKKLIVNLRPLLNIKNNPNARYSAAVNPTQIYKNRRVTVYRNTRLNIGCRGDDNRNQVDNNPGPDAPLYNHQIIAEDDPFVEYVVVRNQHIGEVTRGIEGLPTGRCHITIYNSADPRMEFQPWRRITGNDADPDAQNIYTYFDNISSNNNLRRHEVIRHWMDENDIEEITVRVSRNIQ